MPCDRGTLNVAEILFTSGPWSVARASDAEGRQVRLTTLQLPSGFSEPDLMRLADAFQDAAGTRATAPGLMPVYGSGIEEGVLWLAEAAPTGPSLRETIGSSGPLDPERVVPLLHQVAGALDVLHSAGQAHVWLTPDNVHLAPAAVVGGQPWSLALALLSRMSSGTGWPEEAFAAPEALKGGASNQRAEVFSAAALAAFAATGQDPRTPGVLDGMPPALHASLERGLQADPTARYASVREMAVDVTVEQAIAMQDAADQSAVPAGGDVPDWARDLLAETAARRDAGHPLVGEVPEPPSEEPAPEATPIAAMTPGPASLAPPPQLMAEERRVTAPAPEKPARPKPERASTAFRWEQAEPTRSWATTIVMVVSVLFILAAVALTVLH